MKRGAGVWRGFCALAFAWSLSACVAETSFEALVAANAPAVIVPAGDETSRSPGVATGGEVSPKRYGSSCLGEVPDHAQHVLRLVQPRELRIVASSPDGADLVMVVRGKVGTYCSDDYEGLAPGAQLRLGAGDYLVYVGVREASLGEVPYELTVEGARASRRFSGLSLQDLKAEAGVLSSDESGIRPETIVRLHRILSSRVEGEVRLDRAPR